jgi:hypothetical protein
MKKLFLINFFFFAFFLFTAQLATAQTVYVTEKGKKYHKKNCSVVKEGKKGIEMADAKKSGYDPCDVCKPLATQKAEATDPKKKK